MADTARHEDIESYWMSHAEKHSQRLCAIKLSYFLCIE
jgi:hypothetical protein